MSNPISKKRQVLFYLGTAMMIIGFLLFFQVFIVAFSSMSSNNFNRIAQSFAFAPIGMLFIIAGQYIRSIGQRGLAGSGTILNPDQARKDLKPYAKAAGGLVKDALEEIKPQPQTTVIKVRCKNCQHLNDETDNYCQECGAPIF